MLKKILILGGSGFVGRNLIEHLTKSATTYKIDTPSSKELDLTKESSAKKYLSAKKYDVVIHCAIYNPRSDKTKAASLELENDLRMYYNVERYSDLYGKMLYFGSGAEFDKSQDIAMLDDDSNGNGVPNNPYGLSKYIINKSINQSNNIINLRIFGLYGKYENKYKTFISGLCCKALLDLPFTIRRNVYFDYLYIDDFCRIVEYFINNDAKFKQYNICSGKPIDLVSLANIVNDTSDNIAKIYVCNEGLAKEYTASNKRLLEEIGEFEFTSHEEAIKQLYKWYKQNRSDIDMEKLLYQ